MQATKAAQLSGLAFLDVEAKKQSRMFLWIGLALLPLAVSFPVASMFTGIPFWVAGIMFVCAGMLGGLSILLAFTRGSPVLAYLKEHDDPVVNARIWVEVRRGVRNLQVVCTTQNGEQLHEVLFVNAGADEERVRTALSQVIPTIEAS